MTTTETTTPDDESQFTPPPGLVEAIEETNRLTKKNEELERILASLGAEANPLMQIELRLQTIMNYLMAHDPMAEVKLNLLFQQGLNQILEHSLPEVRKQVLQGPNPGLIVPSQLRSNPNAR